MNKKELSERLNWIYPLFEEAGDWLRNIRKEGSFEIRKKKDGSRVTDADEIMSDFWVKHISNAFSGEIIVSEESESSHSYPANAEVIWYVDPVDGTSKFISGSPNYFILIGLCWKGSPVLGTLFQPERNTLLAAHTHLPARLYTSRHHYRQISATREWTNGKPLLVRGATPLQSSRLEEITGAPVRKKSPAAHSIISPLSGPSSGFISFRRMAYWDLAAPAAIMESCGFQTGVLGSLGPVLYNNGPSYCERFYCLPKKCPQQILSLIHEHP